MSTLCWIFLSKSISSFRNIIIWPFSKWWYYFGVGRKDVEICFEYFIICRRKVAVWAVHKWCHPFFDIFYPSLPLVTHFSIYTYGVTSTFGRSPSLLSGWRHLWMAPNSKLALQKLKYFSFLLWTTNLSAFNPTQCWLVLCNITRGSKWFPRFYFSFYFDKWLQSIQQLKICKLYTNM